MIKTELFIGSDGLESISDYENFIKKHQNIEIISVNLTHFDYVLLTYKEL